MHHNPVRWSIRPEGCEIAAVSAIRRILAAVKNPEAPLLPGVAKATQLARALGAELELFHAIDAGVYVDMLGTVVSGLPQLEDEERDHYRQRLERIAARARLHAPKVSVSAEWDYPCYEAIVRRAIASGADLIVSECHPGPHRAQALLRLTDWELLRLAPLPVLLVKGVRPYHRPTILGAVDPGHGFGKSPRLDEQIVQLAAEFSQALHGELHAVHAYQPPAIAARARSGLETLAAGSGLLPDHCHLVGGEPCDAVEQLAERLHADIVVVGAVSRSGLQRALIGNTAESLLRFLPCDLLIVKPAEFISRVPVAARGARQIAAQPLG
jgi:universal stress protein E